MTSEEQTYRDAHAACRLAREVVAVAESQLQTAGLTWLLAEVPDGTIFTVYGGGRYQLVYDPDSYAGYRCYPLKKNGERHWGKSPTVIGPESIITYVKGAKP